MPYKNDIAIITSGYFPVPAVLGGAVEALDENLIKQNEISNQVRFVVFSCYNQKASEEAAKYKNTQFEFIRIPIVIQKIDKAIYFIAKNLLRKKKSMSYRYITQRLYYINKVAKFLQKYDYDKVVVENHATLFMALKKYDNYKKYVGRYYYHLHNVVSAGYGCNEIIASCKKVIGVSNYINNTLQEFLGEKDHNDYCVLKNKIDRKQFYIELPESVKREIRNCYEIADDDIVILFTGRFNPEKGIKELLMSFRQVKEKNVKLLIVGGYYFGSGMVSPFEREMYDLAEDMKNRVKFTGFIPYDQIPKIYAIADIVVIPSIWDDPAPLTVIEALTSGKSLITTNSGGIPEYADKESSIILRRDKNLVKNLSFSIEKLIKDKQERNRMESAVEKMTADWTIEAYYNDFCKLMRD